ncbi:MAG: HAMP domain-containing histidine kinase, partial [Spirochaetes bacterium]|nr:HAMP domain-containing histidine kinase [Spirochaetota bacterium]
ERIKGDDLNSYNNMIKRSIERINSMRKLILDIIDLTKLESGRKVRNIEEFNIKNLVNKIVEEFSNYASKRNIKLKIFCDDIFIKSDQTDIEMILSNFISNAIKYNRDSGEVNIEIKQYQNNLFISVSDTGIGIKEEDIKKLFNEFVRIKNEKTRNIEGSGLGLSIVKKIVDYYNGSIDVKSEYGKGSTFIVNLPNLVTEKVGNK